MSRIIVLFFMVIVNRWDGGKMLFKTVIWSNKQLGTIVYGEGEIRIFCKWFYPLVLFVFVR